MKNLFLLFLLLPLFTFGSGWDWAKRPYNRAVESGVTACDSAGNIFAASSLPQILVKYDAFGNQVWRDSFRNLIPLSITCCKDNRLIELAVFNQASIVLGSDTLIDSMYGSYYYAYQYCVIKFDYDGSVLWAKNIGTLNSSYVEIGHSIIVDSQDNIYISANYTYNCTVGTNILTNRDTSFTTPEIMIAKFDSSLSPIWIKRFGGLNNDAVSNLSVSPTGDIYFTGWTMSDTARFDSLVSIDTGAAALPYLFLCKLSANGTPRWIVPQTGTATDKNFNGLETDSRGNAYVSGLYLRGTFSLGTYDFPDTAGFLRGFGFITKFDSSGSFRWVREMKSTYPMNIAKDNFSNIWAVGVGDAISDTIDNHVFYLGYQYATFVAGWTSAGDFIEADFLPPCSDDETTIAVDGHCNIYICASDQTDTLIVASDTIYLNGTSEDMVVIKYSPSHNYQGRIFSPDTICKGLPTAFNASSTGGNWHSDFTSIATVGSVSGIVTGLALGIDTIRYQEIQGCGTYNALKVVVVDSCPELLVSHITPSINDIIVAPNPNSGDFFVTVPSSDLTPISITILNIMGQVVYETSVLPNQQNRMELKNCTDGIFILKAVQNEKSAQRKLIIK